MFVRHYVLAHIHYYIWNRKYCKFIVGATCCWYCLLYYPFHGPIGGRKMQ